MNDFAEGRISPREIPGARLVTLDSDNHIMLEDEPAWPVFVGEVDAFLAPDRVAAGTPAARCSLSAREREVLRLAAAARTTPTSRRSYTQRPHRRAAPASIYAKLGLSGRPRGPPPSPGSSPPAERRGSDDPSGRHAMAASNHRVTLAAITPPRRGRETRVGGSACVPPATASARTPEMGGRRRFPQVVASLPSEARPDEARGAPSRQAAISLFTGMEDPRESPSPFWSRSAPPSRAGRR